MSMSARGAGSRILYIVLLILTGDPGEFCITGTMFNLQRRSPQRFRGTVSRGAIILKGVIASAIDSASRIIF